MRRRRLVVAPVPCRNLAITERTSGPCRPVPQFRRRCVLDIEGGDRVLDFSEFAAQILFVSGEDSGLITATQRYGSVTVELYFVDPISRADRVDQHRLHRRHKAWEGRSGYSSRNFRNVKWLTAYRPF